MEIQEQIVGENHFKCYNCGKKFRDNRDYQRHKNKKTPCLIREVAPEDRANPNRCIYCNKILSKQPHLIRHLKACKVKNGGMEILVDKVRYEQEIRILKEQIEKKDTQKDERIRQLEEAQLKLVEKIANIEKAIIPNNVTNNNINNIQNIQNINNTQNNNLNININIFTQPSCDNLLITNDEVITYDKVSKLMLRKLYFNPDLPQNHCMYLVNKKDRSLLLHDLEGWRIVAGNNIEEVIRKLSNTIALKGSDVINALGNPGSDALFTSLPKTSQDKIIDFNAMRDMLSKDDAYEIFLNNRDIVYETIKQSGCKLLT
jgi:uncharacterized C2H2 Zn-finger protein